MAETPPFHTNRSSDRSEIFLTGAAAVNLLAVPGGKPPFAPQKSLIIGGGTAGSAVVVDENDESLAIPVQIGQVIPVDRPLKTITSLTNCSLLCHWYVRAIKADDPNYLAPPLNP